MMMDRVRSFYSQKARLYQFFFIGFLRWEKVLEAFFQDNPYLHSGMKILDAGCGTGPVTKVLHELALRQGLVGITFHGFDLTPAMLDLFREWMEKEKVDDVQLQAANVLDLENQLPRDWSGYELIVSSAMLEYIPEEKLGITLGNLKRLLHKNGRLVLFVTRRTRIAKWIGGNLWGTNLFDRDELERPLHQAGFLTVQFKKLPANWASFMLAVEASDSD